MSIKVFSGKAAVSAGDGVTKDTLLISGVITDKHGKSEVVRADGEVIGRYNEEVTFSQSLEAEEVVISDEIVQERLYLFGKNIGAFSEVEGNTEHERVTNFVSFLGITLTIGISYDTYRVLEEKTVLYTPISAEELVKKQMEDYERIFLSDCDIIDREIERSNTKDGVCLTVKYTLESDICRSKNIVM